MGPLIKRKMPDAALRRGLRLDGQYTWTHMVHTFLADGRRWCDFRGDLLLLRDDGSVVGSDADCVWEAL